jgi:uncharacterized protein YbjQ (UPF0145 family)
VKYFGAVSEDLFLCDRTSKKRRGGCAKAANSLLEQISRAAEQLGGNAVIGLEIHLNPFAEMFGAKGLHLHASGTAAYLEPL